MTGYLFAITCARGQCKGHLEHLTGGTCAHSESKAVARCVECGARWLVTVTLRAA